ncbi:MAG: beta-ketoacyl-ACP synthase III [Candidatus Krumholzibacteriia bacterium]
MQKFIRGSKIAGSGHYCPDDVLTNRDLEQIVDTSDEWILTRTGIRERRIVRPDQAASDLAVAAARDALDSAEIPAGKLDGIIVGTISGDQPFPATACFIQDRLGAPEAVAFDLCAACSGFIYGLNTAHALIASGQLNTVLVVGVEILSKFVDWEERSTCVLFGDGAGAVVLEACEAGEGILGTYMKSDGSLAELLYIEAGGSKEPASAASVAAKKHFIRMKGDGVFKYAVRAMEDASKHVLEQAKLTVDDIDILIPHQANLRIIDSVYKRLRVPEEKVVVNLDRLGNTSAGSIPIAFDEVARSGRLKKGDIVLLVTFGGGLTWGSVLLRYS